MKVGLIGLGRVGENMSRRMIKEGIEVWGYRRDYEKAEEAYTAGYVSGITTSIQSLVQIVREGRGIFTENARGSGIFMMALPAENVEETLNELLQYCSEGDIIIDHGNSNFKDSRRRAERLTKLGIQYIDCGTSGGVYGLKRGFCLMVGGSNHAVSTCSPIFRALSAGIGGASRTDPKTYHTSPEFGWLHCGPSGAGHFVKMVQNGVEYGIMQAYAEGFNILHEANSGRTYTGEGSTKVAPMANPEDYCYDIDVSEVAELWRRGSVISSWLLDLTADILRTDSKLDGFSGGVSDSGEGRWTVNAAVDLGVPTPAISAALNERFNSRGFSSFATKILNGMRYMFGGHHIH